MVSACNDGHCEKSFYDANASIPKEVGLKNKKK